MIDRMAVWLKSLMNVSAYYGTERS